MRHFDLSLIEMWTLLVLAAVLQQGFAADDDLVVEVKDGKVRGTAISTEAGNTYYTWRHIPYAKPPLGKLRFQAPEKPEPWTDVLDGSKDSPACYYVGFFEGDPEPLYGYSEDCLYVNVYSPVPANSSLNLPVMFYMYGGGYITGTADYAFYNPTTLLGENVIVVNFNYRLDIFGFLSTNDLVVPGNAALKDHLAALQWTRDNIASFGGNPEDITIFGESAGGMSVGHFIISPKSRDLFSAAILQSGTSIMEFTQKDAQSNAVRVAQQFDPSITDASTSEEILAVLQAADAQSLVDASLALQTEALTFKPVLEVEHPAAFITNPLYEELAAGNITRVPIIIGTMSEERLPLQKDLEAFKKSAAQYDSNPSLLVPDMPYKEGTNIADIANEVKQAYVGNGTFAEDTAALVRLISDNTFVRPIIKHAILQSEYTPVYFYQFSYAGTRSAGNADLSGCGKAAHAQELGYLFNISSKPIETDADYLARRRIVKLWTNFAKTKNPTPGDDSSDVLQGVTWERFDKDTLNYLDIGDDLEMKSGREAEITAFWEHLWDTYAVHPYNTY